jgi:ribose transport system permease protein
VDVDRDRVVKRLRDVFLPLASLFVLSMLLAIAAPEFLTVANLADLLRRASAVAIAAVGATLVLVQGDVDLSVGSVIAWSGVVGAFAMKAGVPVPAAVAVGVAVGAASGLVNGALVATLRIPAFIVTLGTLGIFRGLALVASAGESVSGLPRSLARLAGDVGRVPVPLLFLVATAGLASFSLRRTRFGRHVQAIGSNRRAAELCGIRVDRVRAAVFAIAGALAGLSGMIFTARLITGTPTVAEGLELDVIAAVVIGGGSLAGGVGTVGGTLIGTAIMQVLANGCVLLGVDPFVQKVLIGAIVIAAVAFDSARRRSAAGGGSGTIRS